MKSQILIGLLVLACTCLNTCLCNRECVAESPYSPPLKLRPIKLPAATAGRDHPIDRIIGHYLGKKGIPSPPLVDDATFLRRAALDLTGLLPKENVVTGFINSKVANKREKLVELLLADKTAYAEHWLTFWNDWLVNDYEDAAFDKGHRKQITVYLYESLIKNTAYDDFVRELIAPTLVSSQGFLYGIRSPGNLTTQQGPDMQFAHKVSQVFLGINGKCASCHDSRINNWTQETVFGLAAISATEDLPLESNGVVKKELAKPNWPIAGLGEFNPYAPRLTRLNEVSWLVTDESNGHFSRAIANRLWAQLMGRGISHPLDGLHHRPWNPGLLEYLANYLVENKFDLKKLLQHIATSQAYQTRSRVDAVQETADAAYIYRGPHAKHLTAEQFLDGAWRITGAAASKTDANIVRGTGRGFDPDDQQVTAQWIWRDIFKGSRSALDGEHLVFRRRIDLESQVAHGAIAVCGDNEFEMFLDGKLVASSDDWLKVQAVPLQGLSKGKHEILVAVRSFLEIPERSGLLFQANMRLIDGTELSIVSDRKWEFTTDRPSLKPGGQIGELDGPWQTPILLERPAIHSQFVINRFKEIIARELGSRNLPRRAVLYSRDELMTLLNRPTRTRVISDRQQGLSRIQCLQLINGNAFADLVAEGAKRLTSEQKGDLASLTSVIYRKALSREVTDAEKAAILQSLQGLSPAEATEDLLWSVFLMPEFLTVR